MVHKPRGEDALAQYGSYEMDAAEDEKKVLDQEGGGDFAKIVPGRNVFRILPPMLGERTPFVVVYQHYINVPGAKGPVVFVCPRLTAKQRCPACEKADKLRRSGNPADMDYAYQMNARRRVFCNVINRKEPERGVQVLGFGKSIHEQLNALRRDPDAGGDFTHPETGFDVVIERTGSGKNDTEYQVFAARRSSALGDLSLLEQRVDLTRYSAVKSVDEIMELLSGVASGTTGGRVPRQDSRGRSRPASRTAADEIDQSDDDGEDDPFA
jgi:hypothetical protein